jgi:hypothetical protein
MSRTIFVRRPWVNYWQVIRYDESKVDQQCKLIRNQVASMDLGVPGFKLYDSHFQRNGEARKDVSGREKYLEWVQDWKQTYAELSQCIRELKSQRKSAGFQAVKEKIAKYASDSGVNMPYLEQFSDNKYRVERTIEALRISAQIMLNARAIGKLASAQLRQRAWIASQKEAVAPEPIAA